MPKPYFKDIRIHTLFLGLIALFPLYRINYTSYAIWLFLLFGLIGLVNSKKNRDGLRTRFLEKKKIFLWSTLIMYVFIFSLIFSENMTYGMKTIQHMLPLLIFPGAFFFLIERLSEKEFKLLLTIFLAACFFQVAYIHINFYRLGLFEDIKQAKFYQLPFREAILNFKYEPLHPTYLSLWYCFAIAILLKGLKRIDTIKSGLTQVFQLLFICLLIATILLLSARIGVVMVIAIMGYYLFRLKNRKMKWVLLFLFLVVTAFSIKNVSYISSRFITEFEQTKLAPPFGKGHNSINIRVGIYQCSMRLIKENVLFGAGIGDVQDRLNSCYSRFDTDAYDITRYNSHNYFFHSLLAAGIIGFISLIVMFYVFFKIAFQHNSYLYISFLVIMILGLLFENMLSRNHGVIFFAFFNTLFVQYFYNQNHANRSNSFI